MFVYHAFCYVRILRYLPKAENRKTIGMIITLSQEEFNSVLANNPNNDITTYTTGLIIEYSIAIQKSGNTLTIVGKTNCVSEVVKCGFKEVKIQQRTSNSASWSDYKTYTDLYADSSVYTLTKSLTVSSGYQYRVVCTHYAKKSLLSTQKIDNTSNIV